ncbi:ArgE/DapE family deacylase [Candidatus Gracilibacteria bacterium]|nr:ArgE/DapE family deacylase [Candidatus Gracilibacteria bacterium]MCF7856715.1 ArgE/DapE family deacylase [Candidatus Gracilibacteria bacterium]MCF7897021.1 ArgE/DapE family deacylase [Candidatus Gracilibacteria bacterium]
MDNVYRFSASDKKLLLTILKKLVAANTVNPPGNEDRVVKVIEQFLKNLGVKYRVYRKAPGRGNIIWSLGDPRLPAVLIAAHSDTVPAGENWQSNPCEMLRKNNLLIGRGVVDNKAPLAGILLATRILQKFSDKLKNRIVFAAVADEECGNKFGMDFLYAKKVFPKISAAVVPDSCGQNREIEIAEKGVLHLKITAFGRQGHGSLPEKSTNAIFILKDFLRQIRKLKFTRRTRLLSPTTIAVTSFHAGAAANVIPGEAVATLDLRFPPNESKLDLLAKIERLADAESKKWGVRKFKFEILADLPSSETPADSPLVKATTAAMQKVSHRRPKIIGMPAFTFAGVLRSQKIPTVAFGPGKLEECHRANEKIREREVFEFTEILVELMRSI